MPNNNKTKTKAKPSRTKEVPLTPASSTPDPLEAENRVLKKTMWVFIGLSGVLGLICTVLLGLLTSSKC